MTCPNCGSIYDNSNRCPVCKLDTKLFNGSVRVSDILYNKGLAKLRINDFSGAIECLNKSIIFNKNNIHARNILGLAYFETGHIGEGLKHWVISAKLIQENNPAVRYINDIQKNGRYLEQLNDAVVMFNHALDYLKNKSDDMAVIQLKKAIDINPKFVDAYNLLTLCYIVQKDRERAIATAEKALQLDINNAIAQNYYFEMTQNRYKNDTRDKKNLEAQANEKKQSGNGYGKINIEGKKSKNFHIVEILVFIAGMVCMFVMLYFVVLPQIYSDNNKKIDDLRTEHLITVNEHESAKKKIEDENDTLINKIAGLNKEINNLENELYFQERTNSVMHAYGLFLDNRLQEAVDELKKIDTTGLAADILEWEEKILSQSYPKLADEYAKAGVAAYNAKDFDLARVKLSDALEYAADGSSQKADALYYLGHIFADSGDEDDIEPAKDIFYQFIDEYPNHRNINRVKQKLASIGG